MGREIPFDPNRRAAMARGAQLAIGAAGAASGLTGMTSGAQAEGFLDKLGAFIASLTPDPEDDLPQKQIHPKGKRPIVRDSHFNLPTYHGAARDYFTELGQTIWNGEYKGDVNAIVAHRDTANPNNPKLIFSNRIKRLPRESLQDFQKQLVNSMHLTCADYGGDGSQPDSQMFMRELIPNLGKIADAPLHMGKRKTSPQQTTEVHTYINSFWRNKKRNATIPGAAKESLHPLCRAIDAYAVDGVSPEALYGWALSRTITRNNQTFDASGGVAYYPKHETGMSITFIHVDDGNRRRWRHYSPEFNQQCINEAIALSSKHTHIARQAPTAQPTHVAQTTSPQKPAALGGKDIQTVSTNPNLSHKIPVPKRPADKMTRVSGSLCDAAHAQKTLGAGELPPGALEALKDVCGR